MATHSSVLAWRMLGTAELGGLPSVGLQSWTRLKQLSSSRHVQLHPFHTGIHNRWVKGDHGYNCWFILIHEINCRTPPVSPVSVKGTIVYPFYLGQTP